MGKRTRASRTRIGALAVIGLVGLAACGDDDEATNASSVAFTAPAADASVAGGVGVAMTAEGITIEPAGEAHEGAGHFHVIADAGCAAEGAAIARDADHVHFGKGQAEGTIYLDPGAHELCLQVGDGTHVALDTTDTVTVNVGIEDLDQWCAVVGEIDVLFEATDTSDDDFAVKQVGYTNIGRLFNQLDAGMDVVDADAREDVSTVMAFGANIASTVATATDEADAAAKMETLWEGEQGDTTMPGADWVAATCGVDIDG